MSQMTLPLSNGYRLIVVADESASGNQTVHVCTEDPDGIWNQELVSVEALLQEQDELFRIKLFLDSESDESTVEYPVGLHHDPDYSEDDDSEVVADEHIEESTEESEDTVSEEETFQPLFYGVRGDAVKQIQSRLKELGYFNGTIGGNYLTKTKAAVEAFQTAAGLQVDGECDELTWKRLMADDAPKAEPQDIAVSASQEYAIAKDWWKSDIQKIFAKGVDATITDVETRLTWRERRRGGTNHADVQPLTKEDTAKLKKAYGGKWSWNRRAIWVTINGVTYAASMNGMPHGGSSIKDNNFDGHHCIHFTNSRTHCSNKVCPKHQAAIKKAATTKL